MINTVLDPGPAPLLSHTLNHKDDVVDDDDVVVVVVVGGGGGGGAMVEVGCVKNRDDDDEVEIDVDDEDDDVDDDVSTHARSRRVPHNALHNNTTNSLGRTANTPLSSR